MALLPMLPLFLSTILAFALDSAAQQPAAPPSAPTSAQDPLERTVIEFGDQAITVAQVLERVAPGDSQLGKLLREDPSYRDAYLASPRFLTAVRSYADLLRLDELGVRKASAEELQAEAKAFAADRKSRLTAESILRTRPMLIELRARLLSQQLREFSTQELRQHMLRSVPEFFGELQCSWIRIPLVDAQAGRALTEEEARRVYATLDETASQLQSGALTWKEAVEKVSQDPLTKERDGAIGILRRDMTDRFEEELLRPLFADLGFKQLDSELLRGPIVAEKWIYLVRIEAMRIDGVPELERARPRVVRSLREHLLHEQLAGIRQVLPATIHAPILPATP